ncbi:hypothetical protein DQ393_00300 [Rhizobium tropici]|uniref:Uncharacterized protein n=1 Tax=Rhizobium tropici TaxID=398 RepID=A0A329YML6_RHITR|nr:hypothetical protein DQ393_00300 [Rhizobium tropici]
MVYREHDAENCKRFSDNIMLYLFDASADSDFRSIRAETHSGGGAASACLYMPAGMDERRHRPI